MLKIILEKGSLFMTLHSSLCFCFNISPHFSKDKISFSDNIQQFLNSHLHQCGICVKNIFQLIVFKYQSFHLASTSASILFSSLEIRATIQIAARLLHATLCNV